MASASASPSEEIWEMPTREGEAGNNKPHQVDAVSVQNVKSRLFSFLSSSARFLWFQNAAGFPLKHKTVSKWQKSDTKNTRNTLFIITFTTRSSKMKNSSYSHLPGAEQLPCTGSQPCLQIAGGKQEKS